MKKTNLLNEKGMTLVELLAVIVILGVISAIGVVSITKVIEAQRDQAFIGNALALKEATSLYIQQEIVEDTPIEEKITYEKLYNHNLINKFKDPDTGKILEPSENIYILIEKNSPHAIYLEGEKRCLCDGEGAVLFSELSVEFLFNN